ncbi:tetratricopeptide repeat protein [Poriferisphaera sp. WC338]|uniref:tetratricopeptide repeat protein n=1 Tax=Poriferisphaera sp. WC338 TaxID=3425129 RepID=UPI003D81A6AF
MNLHKRNEALCECDLARAALGAHLLDVADNHITTAIKLAPDDPAARLLEAQLATQLNQYDRALAALDTLPHLTPNLTESPEALILRAKTLAAKGSRTEALRTAEKLVEDFPADTEMQKLLLGLQLSLADTSAATTSLESILEDSLTEPWIKRVLTQLQQSESPQYALSLLTPELDSLAELYLEEATSNDELEVDKVNPQPDHEIDLHLLRAARLAIKADRHTDAERLYQKLIAAHPEDQSLLLEAGNLALQRGDEESALDRLERAADHLGSLRLTALQSLAKLHLHTGRFHSAALQYHRITRLFPKQTHAWAGLLVTAHLLGRIKLVRRAQHQLRLHAPRAQRRQTLASLWQHVAAPLAFQNELSSQNNLAEISPLDELLAESQNTLKLLTEEHPKRADAHYHSAAAAESQGNLEQANLSIQTALKINPNYAAAQKLNDRLGRVQLRLAA